MTETIQVSSLIKRYGQKNVVDGIQFSVKSGECFGILGPNGAGKTSTMRMLYGSSRISAGELTVLGKSVRHESKWIKSQIGVVPQDDGLDPDFTTRENLLVYSRYHRIPTQLAAKRADELLNVVGLSEKANDGIQTLSGGMKRRLCIARALINEPQILFLDEPTTGLDPQARQWIWSKVRELKRSGKTVVLTTHYMDEAEQLCDRIAIMQEGKIFATGSPQELIEKYVGQEVVEFDYKKEELTYLTEKFQEKYQMQILDDRVRLFIRKGQDGKSILNLIASDSMTVRRATLEDVFLKITGHHLKD
jgi:lipooligosaccharide transport system ATP-binding protein